MKKRPFLACGILLGISLIFSLVAGIPKQDSFPNNEVSATAQTNVDFRLIGDGVYEMSGDKWTFSNSIPMKEIASGIYTKTIFAKSGQVCVAEYDNWGNSFGFNDLETSDAVTNRKVINAQEIYAGGSPNVYINGSWGYYKFRLDTTKSSNPLRVDLIYASEVPTIAGTGVSGGSWTCSDENYIFKTEDGVHFYNTITTVANNPFRVVGLNTFWVTYANYDGLQNTSCEGDFTAEGNDRNFQSSENNKKYLIYFNKETGNTWFFEENGYENIYYVEGNSLRAHELAESDQTFTPTTYYSSDNTKRFYGYYTDESLTTGYNPSKLSDDLILYGDYREYSKIVYFAVSPSGGWPNGANVYAWDSDLSAVTNPYPGNAMTWRGAGIYSYEFVGEQNPYGYKFSQINSADWYHTDDVIFGNNENFYIQTSDSYLYITEAMVKAEVFSATFISDVGSSGDVSSSAWATSKNHAADVLADSDAIEIIQSGDGIYAEAGLDDWVEDAVGRYEEIVLENGYEDYLEMNLNNFTTLYPSDIENCIYVGGRHITTNDYITMDWGLSSLEFNITGGGVIYLNGNLLDNDHETKLAVVIDGGTPSFKALSEGDNHIQITKRLSASTHKIEIYKTTQALGNPFNLTSIEVDENAVITKVPAKSMNIEVIGDSIAATEIHNSGDDNGQNAYYGFARQLKDAYNANVNLIARSGIGLMAGYNSGSASTSNQMNSIYDYTNFYRDETASLDATQFVPDIIVVSLGNNDLGSWIMSQLGHTISDFTTAVASFNSKLHTYYPNAKIIWAYGGFINRSYLSEFRTAVEADSYASFVYLPKFGGSNPNVDDHPSITEYKEMADFISTEIARLLNEGVEVQDRIQNPLKQRMMFEAEECNVSGGNKNYSDGYNWSNGKAVQNTPSYALGGYIGLDYEFTRTSTYKIRVGGSGNGGNLPLYVDDELVSSSVTLSTSNWFPSETCDDYVDISVTITKGEHNIKIGGTTNGGWINHDFIEIIEVEQLDCETFYQSFMNQTRAECTSSASSHSFDFDLWTSLASEYAELDGDNKDYVCDVYGDLVERYTLIMNTYHYNDFLIKSDGTHVYNARTFFANVSSNMPILIVGSFIGITIVGSFFLLRKKDDNYQL